MKIFKFSIFYLLAVALSWPSMSQNIDSKPTQLRCEYMVNPIGVDSENPRLTWRMDDDRNGAGQTAYEILIGTDSLDVLNGKANLWDSGKITSDDMLVTYSGPYLRPFGKYYWKINIWDQDGQKSSSEIASFEMGMMGVEKWKGDWISDNHNIDHKPAPYFRTEFGSPKEIRSARAYISSAGLYELSINGEKIGDHVLDPAYTRFDRRLLYETYDVTSEIRQGENAIGVILGNGWYNHQSTAVWGFHEAPWRGRPAFCFDLRITYTDGTEETISSGKSWKTFGGPVVFNSIYTAEHYDARLTQSGWDKPGFDDSEWKEVIYRSVPSQNIVSQMLHPVRHIEELTPESVSKVNDSTYIVDFGRNISGVTELSVTTEEGVEFRLKHGERLGKDGRVDMSNIDAHYRPQDDSDPFQTDIFIAGGKGPETFCPRFNYKGFQYVEVSCSQPVSLDASNFKAYFMHSDVPESGQFQTSSDMLNKLMFATNSSYLSNLFGYPTDCPQREKNGWTGDAHIAIETGLYSYDGITVYEKWLKDHLDEQQPNGVLPAIIPTNGWGYEWANGPDWTSSIAIIPWNIYTFYGDTRLLAECYEGIRKYVDHIDDQYPSGLTTWGLGDWIPIKSRAPVELTSSVYYYVDANILAKAAKLLGKEEDHQKYAALASKIKRAVNDKYFHPETAIYGEGLQTELSVPLFWGVAPDSLQTRVAQNLADRVEADGNQLDVGLLGTKAILGALSQNGQAEKAFELVSREAYPSWGWWIANGATTLYENWKIDASSDISMNHIMFGHVGGWFYKSLAGINYDPANPGFKRILLTPHFPEDLQEISAYHDSRFGRISSQWKRKGRKVSMQVTIPANTSALFTVPKGMTLKRLNGNSIEESTQIPLVAGTYEMMLIKDK